MNFRLLFVFSFSLLLAACEKPAANSSSQTPASQATPAPVCDCAKEKEEVTELRADLETLKRESTDELAKLRERLDAYDTAFKKIADMPLLPVGDKPDK